MSNIELLDFLMIMDISHSYGVESVGSLGPIWQRVEIMPAAQPGRQVPETKPEVIPVQHALSSL
jgi:hypothetical protein